jgi:hypothetical protein
MIICNPMEKQNKYRERRKNKMSLSEQSVGFSAPSNPSSFSDTKTLSILTPKELLQFLRGPAYMPYFGVSGAYNFKGP